jgi:ubiquinone/menaquinone biosynthesis C-methylase UbiE
MKTKAYKKPILISFLEVGKMLQDKPEDAEILKERYDEKKAEDFVDSERTFQGRLYRELEWERLVKNYLPEDKGAKILDAGGGTGRMTLPLAELGYRVTLSDLSPGMLAISRKKLREEELLDRVEIKEADLASLPFPSETFDLVVCLHGAFSAADSLNAAKELSRVTKRGGKIIVDALGRYWAATHELINNRNPELALKLLKSESNRAYDLHGDWDRVFTQEEFKELFEENGIRVIGIYGSFYESLPTEILERQEWDDILLSQVVEIMTYLSEVPSVIGMAGGLILVGEKVRG